MKGIQSLRPQSKTFLDLATLQEMATKYGVHLSAEDLVYEVPQAKRLLNRKAEGVVETMQQLAEFLEPYKDAFHSLFRLIIIAIVILSVLQAASEASQLCVKSKPT